MVMTAPPCASNGSVQPGGFEPTRALVAHHSLRWEPPTGHNSRQRSASRLQRHGRGVEPQSPHASKRFIRPVLDGIGLLPTTVGYCPKPFGLGRRTIAVAPCWPKRGVHVRAQGIEVDLNHQLPPFDTHIGGANSEFTHCFHSLAYLSHRECADGGAEPDSAFDPIVQVGALNSSPHSNAGLSHPTSHRPTRLWAMSRSPNT